MTVAQRTVSVNELAQYLHTDTVDVAVVGITRSHMGTLAFALSVALEQLDPECGEYRSADRKLRTRSGSVVHFVSSYELYTLRLLKLHAVVFDGMDAASGPMVLEMASDRCVNEGTRGVLFLEQRSRRGR